MTIKTFDIKNFPDNFISVLNQHADFFTSFSWYCLFVQTVNPTDYAFLVHEKENFLDTIVLPVKYENSRFFKTVTSLTNFYSPIYRIARNATIQQLTYFLKEFKSWDIFKLEALDEHDAIEMVAQLKNAKIPAITFFCFGNWYLEVNGRSYEMYFEGLSSRVKNTVNRKTKKFLTMPNTKLQIVSELQNLEIAISAYQQVYAASWKISEGYSDFIPELCRLAASESALRLGLAYINDVPVAAQLWIVADNTAYIYKLAYDESYKNYAVGSILTATLMQHVIDVDKVAVVDYLTGDDSYKKDWMPHRRERWGIVAFNTTRFFGIVAMLKAFSKVYLRRLVNYVF